MTYKRGTLLRVTWKDVVSDSSWTDKEDLKPATCVSVGFFTMQKDKTLYLHASYNEEDIGDRIAIPKALIKSIEVLNEDKSTG